MKINFKKIDHVQICIPIGAESETAKFYEGILGLKRIEKPDALKPNGGMWYKIAGIQLHIGVEEMAGKSKRHPAFEIENAKASKIYFKEQGVRIKEDTPIPGIERFSIYDTYGNRIELLEKI